MTQDDVVMQQLEEWTTRISKELGVPREIVDVTAVLALAGEAAHAVARPAAPVTTFVVGYAAAVGAGQALAGPEALASALQTAMRLCREVAPS